MSLLTRKIDAISLTTTAAAAAAGGGPLSSLAAVESLTIPLVEEVVFMADLRCSRCRERVSEILKRMNRETNESVVISVVEKKVTLTFTHPNSKRR